MMASTQPTPSPTATPTTTASTKSPAIAHGFTTLTIAAMVAFNATSAVASLSRLSPSSTVTSRRGRCNRPAIAVTATVSVGATTAPNANAAASVSDGTTHQVANPTTTTVNTTSPTESRRMPSRLARTSTKDVWMDAANRSGGSSP